MVTKLALVFIFVVITSGTTEGRHRRYNIDPYHNYNGLQSTYEQEDYQNQNAAYDFGYEVNDQSTGDVKSHQESRKNGVVSGRYELIDPDGYKRIVEYTADAIHGFNAVVRRIPLTDYRAPIIPHEIPVYTTATPIIHAPAIHAPILGTTPAPILARPAYSTVTTPHISTVLPPVYSHATGQIPHSSVYVATNSAPSVDLQAPPYNPSGHGFLVPATGFSYDKQYYK